MSVRLNNNVNGAIWFLRRQNRACSRGRIREKADYIYEQVLTRYRVLHCVTSIRYMTRRCMMLKKYFSDFSAAAREIPIAPYALYDLKRTLTPSLDADAVLRTNELANRTIHTPFRFRRTRGLRFRVKSDRAYLKNAIVSIGRRTTRAVAKRVIVVARCAPRSNRKRLRSRTFYARARCVRK